MEPAAGAVVIASDPCLRRQDADGNYNRNEFCDVIVACRKSRQKAISSCRLISHLRRGNSSGRIDCGGNARSFFADGSNQPLVAPNGCGSLAILDGQPGYSKISAALGARPGFWQPTIRAERRLTATSLGEEWGAGSYWRARDMVADSIGASAASSITLAEVLASNDPITAPC